MLDQETKKRINDLRDTLVGKVPDPKSQVEQIMIALIFKFMNDMDKESADLGGKASFFVGEFEKFSWSNMFDPRVSGDELVELYSDAIESMDDNPNIPQIFRDIFKNAFIPYKDPETLRLFLKQINEFEYSKDSEQLGDAFEHILNSLSSQGDAGQFRTPRHIIDFIVEIVDPKKDETVLDPASGTSGFLISAFKHIVNANSEKSSGDLLSAAERKKIMKNINGYDISPDMVRIGLANMYLHGFPEPNVVEYDALTSEDRWNEYYDVILANPPFMTPKGGIRPHNKFGLKSNRAEVLFVDYILTHLKPKGRAGIIVPEGIIFQSGKAYKDLRKKLVENGLIGVISLPAGVFNPYSPVKTSILIIDKNKQNKDVFMTKILNDGYSLGSQRNPIELNDLPKILNLIKKQSIEDNFHFVSRSEIIKNKDITFQLNQYIKQEITSSYNIVELKEVAEVNFGTRIVKKNTQGTKYDVYGGGGKTFRTDEFNRENELIVSRFAMSQQCVRFVEGKFYLNDSGLSLKVRSDKINQKFLNSVLLNIQDQIYSCGRGAAQKNLNIDQFYNINIPLPPLDKQQEIVDEIEQYQKVIDGARQVVENYRPKIFVKNDWKVFELKDIYKENLDSKRVPITKNERKQGPYPYYGATGIIDYVEDYLFDEYLLLISEDGANLLDRNYPIAFSVDGKTWVNNHVHVLKFDNPQLQKYVEFYINQISIEKYVTGTAQPKLNQNNLNLIKIPIPKDSELTEIVKKLDNEIRIVKQNKTIIQNLEFSINRVINSLYNS